MSYSLVFRIQGFLLLFLGVCMCVPPAIGACYHDGAAPAFGFAVMFTLAAGALLIFIFPASEKQITHRDGFIIVSLGWVLATLFGCLPFIFNGTFHTFSDACFETVAGFTTTGATVLQSIEPLPRSILFWRSMIQWLGGMGIILFSIAILPMLGIGGMQLYKAEVPGPVVEKIKPRIAETARSLWKVYILLTLAQALLLILSGLGPFDAVCHSFTTMATGGFSTRNASIEAFANPTAEWIMIVFMFAAGVNFSLHYRLFHGKPRSMLRDREFMFYTCTLLGAAALICLTLLPGQTAPLTETIRQSLFQATSIMTTTGYSTTNFDTWPLFAQTILLLLMFVGGCAGSTGGGMKNIRVLLLFKQCYREIFYMIHPHAVAPVKIGGRSVPEQIMRGVIGFVVLYLLVFALGCLAMSLCGLDFMTAVSSVAATLGNVGPGFGAVGPYGNFAPIPVAGKWVLIIMMLLGRLELFTFIILCVPEYWKK